MLWVSAKNIFRRDKLSEPHWTDDKNWFLLEYKEN